MADEYPCGPPNLDENGFKSGDSESDEDDDGWDEIEEYETNVPAKCLFCSDVFESAEITWEHCESAHGFRMKQVKRKHDLDFYGCIKLVNFIRQNYNSDGDPRFYNDVLPPFPWESEDFLKPVLPDDPMLQFGIDDDSDVEDQNERQEMGNSNPIQSEETVPLSQYLKLKNELKLSDERARVAESALCQAMEDLNQVKSVMQHLLMNESQTVLKTSHMKEGEEAIEDQEREEHEQDDDLEEDPYFCSYSHFGIHEEMIKDKVRTETYREFILGNPEIFKDKIVLDIGCGTGILSMFAAQAGAKKVIGVDQSSIIYHAMDIVRENNLDDKITLLKGKVEEVTLPVQNVDIIVSEWMGYCLLFESMLDTVLYARNKWLSKSGMVFPNKCDMSLTALGNNKQDKLSFWDDIYGFKMSCMKQAVVKEASVSIVDPDSVVSKPSQFIMFDLNKTTVLDLTFKAPFTVEILKEDTCAAFVVYFDIFFDKNSCKPKHLSTSPFAPATHWKQTVLYLKEAFPVKKGQNMKGNIAFKKHKKDDRALDIMLELFTDNDKKPFLRQVYLLQ